ncbi:hypothetical protein DL95DRAFT_172411 [Leptodontidium sp. 2 PMI_412]|nr:hypothetical protein DL95DRAFT_172411 [Leptodontidium sp. 2 PMI_412]
MQRRFQCFHKACFGHVMTLFDCPRYVPTQGSHPTRVLYPTQVLYQDTKPLLNRERYAPSSLSSLLCRVMSLTNCSLVCITFLPYVFLFRNDRAFPEGSEVHQDDDGGSL